MQRIVERRTVWTLLLAAAILRSGDVAAEQSTPMQNQHWPAEKILPAEPGRKACWRRVYNPEHLAAHPQQKVRELTFLLRVSGYDADGRYVFEHPHHVYYNFALSLKRRGDTRALATSGDCLGEKTADCAVDCDGGGVTIEKSPNGDGLTISLHDRGIAFGGDCDTNSGAWVRPGADDKVFHLDRVSEESCKALEKERLGTWTEEPEH